MIPVIMGCNGLYFPLTYMVAGEISSFDSWMLRDSCSIFVFRNGGFPQLHQNDAHNSFIKQVNLQFYNSWDTQSGDINRP
jgi:hypothetical protein